MSNYTIVEPNVEFFEPPTEDNYLEFLEKCTRVCYKSEKNIKPGSAEKLMNKVVKEYEHYSVTEHANIIMKFEYSDDTDWGILNDSVDRFNGKPGMRAARASYDGSNKKIFYLSGNIRAFLELLAPTKNTFGGYPYGCMCSMEMYGVVARLVEKWPFFFGHIKLEEEERGKALVSLVDENPFTNKDNLTVKEMKQHMTLTFKFTGSRVMSHQLVRHRLFAFSQESQRYCNYGKKGYQIIVPKSIAEKEIAREEFLSQVELLFEDYESLLTWKIPPEDARFLLPNCTKTEVVTTGTIGYWLDHVIPHRGHNPKAQWEIRKLRLDAENIIKERLPVLF